MCVYTHTHEHITYLSVKQEADHVKCFNACESISLRETSNHMSQWLVHSLLVCEGLQLRGPHSKHSEPSTQPTLLKGAARLGQRSPVMVSPECLLRNTRNQSDMSL